MRPLLFNTLAVTVSFLAGLTAGSLATVVVFHCLAHYLGR
jgi:hypothetical protein